MDDQYQRCDNCEARQYSQEASQTYQQMNSVKYHSLTDKAEGEENSSTQVNMSYNIQNREVLNQYGIIVPGEKPEGKDEGAELAKKIGLGNNVNFTSTVTGLEDTFSDKKKEDEHKDNSQASGPVFISKFG